MTTLWLLAICFFLIGALLGFVMCVLLVERRVFRLSRDAAVETPRFVDGCGS